jgi:hypothetical protein
MFFVRLLIFFSNKPLTPKPFISIIVRDGFAKEKLTFRKFLTPRIPNFSVAKRKLQLICFFFIKPATVTASEKNGFPQIGQPGFDTKQRQDVEKLLSSPPHSERL